MEKLKITKQFLDNPANQEAIANIQQITGLELKEGEVLEYDSALCNGKQCADDEICVLGNCVKDDVPENTQ